MNDVTQIKDYINGCGGESVIHFLPLWTHPVQALPRF